MEEKYRVGVAGCGGISRTHTRGWQGLPNVELVAAMDIKSEAVDKFAEEFSVSAKYTDYREMFEKEDLDIVSICTWQNSHAEIAVAAAEAGLKGILCEKPMCVSLGEADAMLAACENSGTKMAIGHHGRFSATNTEARRLVAEGAIGQPTLMIRRSGGGLLNNGTHTIDGIRYILGDPETEWVIGQVERNTDKFERRTRIEDLCSGLICFKTGTRAVIESDMPGPDVPAALVYGTEGILKTGEGGLLLLNDKTAGWQVMKPRGNGISQYAELLGWIEGKNEHRGNAIHSHAVIEIMMAIYESLRIRGVVRMPLATKASPLGMMIDDGTLPVLKPGKYDIRVPF